MRNDIQEKLSKELKRDLKYESQVVYILSRIRKLLEIENAKRKYKVLNFYSNWSLHSKIDRTEPVREILKEFIEKKGERHGFIFYTDFEKELKAFLTEHGLPILRPSKIKKFKDLLSKTISDTPLEILLGTKYRIILKDNPGSTGMGYEITTEEI